jgi:peptide/nickel transport system ATP-binding protein
MSETLLNIKNLSIYYHLQDHIIKAVDEVDLEINDDEVFGIVGESGSGKSTLCMGILRMISPPGKIITGHIQFRDMSLLSLSDEEFRKVLWNEISYIPQGSMNSLNPIMRIRDQFYDVYTDHEEQYPNKVVIEHIKELLSKIHLNPRVLDKFPHELSGGMRQRVCIALAMLLKPKLIIADEPTSALDVISQRAVLESIIEIRKKLGASVILVGHDMALQAQVSDRMGIMYSGHLVEIGSTIDLFKEPVHPYTQRLISSVPSIQKKQDFHQLAQIIMNNGEKYVFKTGFKMKEIKPGHYVAEYI